MFILFLETEKYAHVTFFFNGGVEKQFENEERHMISSPKVATYDKDPKMSVQGVADKVAELVKKGEHEFVMCNFAPPDMVSVWMTDWLRQDRRLTHLLGWSHWSLWCHSWSYWQNRRSGRHSLQSLRGSGLHFAHHLWPRERRADA